MEKTRYAEALIFTRALLLAVVFAVCAVIAAVLPQTAWADDEGPYAMIYKNSNGYTYTLVFQNDNVPDARYGTLVEEHAEAICDSPNPGGACRCWDSFDTNLDITSVVVRDAIRPHTLDSWFWGMSSLESVDLAKLDTSQVYDMSFAFYSCSKLKDLDLSTFKTSQVTTFSRMFAYCRDLKSVNLSSFETANATDMASMFAGCNELESLDLCSFDMRNVLDATSMFPDNWGKLATVKVGPNGNVRSLLPTPDHSYIEGATGKWVNEAGTAYDSASIPSFRAATYTAQRGYSVDNMSVSLAGYWYDYNGKAIEPAVAVKLDYITPLKEGVDYTVAYKNNVNAGTATVVITGTGNYGGTTTETFNISAFDISKAQFTPIGIKDYTGKKIKPVPVIKANGSTLKVNKDFMCTYYWNKDVGKATIYVKGKGNYSGSKWLYFTIAKRAKQSFSASPVAKTVKASVLKKKAVSLSKPVTVKKAKGKVTYKNVSSQKVAKKFKVNAKNGKITLNKGTKKGTYKVKIKVTAAGNSKYKPASKTVTVKVRVK